MSKVEMDLSEYNSMLDTKRLLEETNKKLETSYQENKRLQQEKVDALKKSENTVTIIEKKQITQQAYLPRPTGEVRDRLRRVTGGIDLPSDFSSSDIQHHFLGALFEFNNVEVNTYENEKVYSESITKVRDEMKREIKNKIDKDTKIKLESIDNLKKSLKEANTQVVSKNEELKSMRLNVSEMLSRQMNMDEELTYNSNKASEKQRRVLEYENLILEVGRLSKLAGMFNSSTTIRAIKEEISRFNRGLKTIN